MRWEDPSRRTFYSFGLLFSPEGHFVAIRIVKVRKLAFRWIAFGRIGHESFALQERQSRRKILDVKYNRDARGRFRRGIGFFAMDGEEKLASGGVELGIIAALEFLGIEAQERIPVRQHLCLLAWLDRDRANKNLFRWRRVGPSRRRKQNQRDQQMNFPHDDRQVLDHKFQTNVSSSPISGSAGIAPIQSATNPSPFPCSKKSQVRAHARVRRHY